MSERKFFSVLDSYTQEKKNKRNYLMMFEFEKIELIDERREEEIDQIRC